MIDNSKTICAVSTAMGGAIAVVRMSGSDAIAIAQKVFSKPISNDMHGRVVYGNVVDAEGAVIDEVLLSIFRAPHSYTGEESVELSCHGSRYIVSRVIELLIANGAHQAAPGEFTQRAFLNGKLDLSQAEAVADLIASSSAAQHRIAMSQLRGGVSKVLSQLREQLLHLTSLMELELDFADHEDLEFADRTDLLNISLQIQTEVRRLSVSFRLGNAIKEGIPVAIIGAPNVGKSTLLNQLLGEEKAIVTDIEGTTRDVIEDTVVIGGTIFRFIDTAGIRSTEDMIERIGIERSREAAAKAQIIILLNEPGVPFIDIAANENQHIIRRTNKTESFSALNNIGINELRHELLSCVTSPDQDILISNARHHEALLRADEAITTVITALSSSLPTDLISEDLRLCLHHLSEITGGEITPNDVLGNIFKHFCIGK